MATVITGWTTKWTVLFDRGIQFFNNDKDSQAQGYMPLTASSEVKECTSFDGVQLKNCFVVFVSTDGFKVTARYNCCCLQSRNYVNYVILNVQATDRMEDDQHQYIVYGQCENHQQYLMWVSQLSHAIVDLKNSARDDVENITNFNTETRRKVRSVC